MTDVDYQLKYLRSIAPLPFDGRWMKRYQITGDATPLDAAVQVAADAFLPTLLPPMDETTPPAGFAVVYQVADAVWLNCYAWVWDNVIHFRTAEASTHRRIAFRELTHTRVGCVWELAPLAYERSSWVRHMCREPENADLGTYLADVMPQGWFD